MNSAAKVQDLVMAYDDTFTSFASDVHQVPTGRTVLGGTADPDGYYDDFSAHAESITGINEQYTAIVLDGFDESGDESGESAEYDSVADYDNYYEYIGGTARDEPVSDTILLSSRKYGDDSIALDPFERFDTPVSILDMVI